MVKLIIIGQDREHYYKEVVNGIEIEKFIPCFILTCSRAWAEEAQKIANEIKQNVTVVCACEYHKKNPTFFATTIYGKKISGCDIAGFVPNK